jgi:hypothetical protein
MTTYVISASALSRMERGNFNQFQVYHIGDHGRPICARLRGEFTEFDPKEYVPGETHICHGCVVENAVRTQLAMTAAGVA